MSNQPQLSPTQRGVLLSSLKRDGLVPHINTMVARSLKGKGLIEDASDEVRGTSGTMYLLTARGFELARREEKRRKERFGEVKTRKM